MGLPEGAPEVLARPTRARLFSLLGELKRSAGTGDLADLLGLHTNAYRGLVRWLAQAILIEARGVEHHAPAEKKAPA